MSKVFNLTKLKVGQIAEIVELNEKKFTDKLGISKGMSVIILQPAVEAVDWLVQIGKNQLFLNKDMLNKIKVKLVSI